MTSVSRRSFVAGGLAATALPNRRLFAASGDPDVIVIGAGAAGVSAANSLAMLGKSVVVVEAGSRIGGRAWTDTETFGVPFDRGASWISSANHNPLKPLAEEGGFTIVNHEGADEAFYVGDRPATDEEWGLYDAAYSAVNSALSKAGVEGIDVAASMVMPQDLPYRGVAESWIGPMDMGVDFKDLSTKDFWAGADTEPNYMIKEGLGTLIQHLGKGLPIHLNTPATRVDWSGDGVAVETPEGTIRAKACIVTVSTGALASGGIRFEPALPDWKLQAIEDVPMGLLVKVALQFEGTRLGLNPNDWLTYWVPNDVPAEACYFLTWPFEFDVMIGFLGGDFGWELSKAGADVAIDFALGEVVKMVGSDAAERFVRGDCYLWAEDRLTLGAYAATKPGRAAARQDLARPVGDRIFFAGEAVAGSYAATVGGAYMSGKTIGRAVSNVIG